MEPMTINKKPARAAALRKPDKPQVCFTSPHTKKRLTNVSRLAHAPKI
jgi:hypothetical protein